MSPRALRASGLCAGLRVQADQGSVPPGSAVLGTDPEVMAGCLTGEGSGLRYGRAWGPRSLRCGWVDQGRRAEYRTHLEFLLGHKILHAPNDLDGGPVVLPQPAVENGEEGVSADQMVIPRPPLSEGSEASQMCPPSPAKGWAFPETRSVIDPLRWGSASSHPGGRRRG